jgi:SdiA-regulated
MTGQRRATGALLALAALTPAATAGAQTSFLRGTALARYDLAAPPADRWELPKVLQEISGLAVDSAGRLFAHDDERAIIYQLDPATHRVLKRFSFGRPALRGDFEAIALVGGQIILTTSDGVLYAGREGRDGESVPYVTQATGAGRYCEIEGMAFVPGDRSLLLACKQARTAALTGHLAVLRWSLDQRALDSRPRLFVPLTEITPGLRGSTFHPSDLVRLPGTGHYLVLAARERAIVELSEAGKVVEVRRLRRGDHPQAEGLALGREGALLVADEGGNGRGTISVYRRR